MEDLIDRIIYHPHLAMPMLHLTDLMGSANCSWTYAAFAIASSLPVHLSRVLRRRGASSTFGKSLC
jgi:hypothetical protein